MIHKGTQTIKTPRLTLRRFIVDDALEMFKNWANDERVTKYLNWQPHENLQVTENILKDWCSCYKDQNAYYNWGIERNGKLIGSISVVSINEENESVEVGYCLSYDFWNKGFMSEAAQAVIDFLFYKVKVHRIEITHAVKNPASGRVAQKCALTYEGTKREVAKISAQEFLDVAFYSILRSEWEKNRNYSNN